MEQNKGTGDKPNHGDQQESVYSYGVSGIEERHGHVPLWLWGVAVVLVLWGVYYLIANWSPPA
ncbi:hypothetical protein FGKAn22_22950 [Ferrigenium kumadai]|uniref:Uncharacterized protein n=1 Tax=Ferrigenium kumadai TaxID=1682490 RepID=A0AAN1T0Q7_9PROT|nr:hypothetical protein [Ferrigenium kumadai]BBJ00603.1 hypothetical protein FGKAn22_22950 [Ferrigenium kumadai]